jgi:hypothetical protein
VTSPNKHAIGSVKTSSVREEEDAPAPSRLGRPRDLQGSDTWLGAESRADIPTPMLSHGSKRSAHTSAGSSFRDSYCGEIGNRMGLANVYRQRGKLHTYVQQCYTIQTKESALLKLNARGQGSRVIIRGRKIVHHRQAVNMMPQRYRAPLPLFPLRPPDILKSALARESYYGVPGCSPHSEWEDKSYREALNGLYSRTRHVGKDCVDSGRED